MNDHYEKLARMYKSAPIQALYPQTFIDIKKGCAVIEIPIQHNHLHAANAVHGSVYFRMLDDSAFFAANSLVNDFFVLTVAFNTNLVRPVSSGILRSEGEVQSQKSNLITSESKLYDENNKIIGFGTGQFMISKIQLNEEIGYV